jgi:hypothetical protein
MKSTIPVINFSGEEEKDGISLHYFRRIYFEDSIFSFFPYGEVYFIDQTGAISDKVFFMEGLEFAIGIGYNVVNEHGLYNYLYSFIAKLLNSFTDILSNKPFCHSV